jgi:hypothetical protein
MPMRRFLTQPPPAAIAVLNAIIGLVMPLFGTFFLFAFILGWTENSRSLETILLPIPIALSAALVGLLACAGLAWATPAGKRRQVVSYLLVAASFAVSAWIVIGRFPFYFGQPAPPAFVVVLVVGACGAVMAWAMAIAARNFGATPFVPSIWITVLGAAIAALGLAISIFTDPTVLFLLPAFWLCVVTYASLKPRPGG